MNKALITAGVLLCALPGALAAVDLEALPGVSGKAACVVYVAMDLGARYRAGAISQPDYTAQATALVATIRGQGGRPNAALESRIDDMIARINAEDPGEDEVRAKAAFCRRALGL